MRTARPGEPIRTLIALGIFLLLANAFHAQSQSTVCFKSLSDYSISTGANPYSISIGDLNGDGKKDIAVANLGDGTVQVLLGASNRRFVNGARLDVGQQPLVVHAIDVDGDGDRDLATLRDNSIAIALNDSHGVFGEIQTFEIGSAYHMAAGDFNNDGKIDLVSSGDAGLFIHISNGDGTFDVADQALEPTGTSTVKVVDFNNDGKKDVIVAVGMTAKMFGGNGNGTFTLKDSETFVDYIYDFDCGDVNHDGKSDVLAMINDNSTRLIAGDGAGNFGTPTTFAHNLTDPPVITDVNSDGVNDIVLSYSSGESIWIYFGQGGGVYNNPEKHMGAAMFVSVEDMDGDGKKDLVTVEPTNDVGGVSVLFANNGAYDTMSTLSTSGAAADSFTHDLNGDGKLDLVISERFNRIFVYLNSPTGYSNPGIYEIADPMDVIANIEKGKFNGDAHMDFVVTLFSGKVNVWLNDGDGTFTDGGLFNCGSGGDVTAADFDGDSDLDLAVTNRLDNSVSILLGNGTGTFAPPTTIPVGNLPTSIASADLNNDNKIDLVVGSEGNDKVSIVIGNGSATFLTAIDVVGGSDVDNHVSLQDLNNDGLPEIVSLGFHQVSNVDPGYIAIRRNLGNGFAAPIEIACAGGRKGIGYGDFDGDGKIDMAVAGSHINAVGVYLNNGALNFSNPEVFETGMGVIAATGDINGDSKLDILAVSDGDAALLILENTTAHAVATGPTTFCTGSVTLNANPNAMVYEWSGGPNTSSTNSMVASKRGVYIVTASNFSGRCSTTSSITVDGPPQDPELHVSNPTCADPTGLISVLEQDDDDMYSFDNGVNYQTSNTLGQLAPGTYNIIIKSDAGCLSETAQGTIGIPPTRPPAAQAQSTDPTCEILTGSIDITVRAATDTYSIDDGVNFTADHLITDLSPGAYQIVIMNDQGCMSPSVEVLINEGPPRPASLSVEPTDPTCTKATGSISVIVQNDGETYSFDNGETFQTSNTKEGLVSGTYFVIIKNQEGCNSEATETVIFPRPEVPTTPVTQITQPTCSEATGSIAIVMQSEGEEYSFDNGTNFQTNRVKSGVTSGTYSIVIRSAEGCSSVVSTATVKTQPVTPGKPEVTATTQSNGDVLLKVSASASEYHWLKDGAPITNANTSSYTATASGNYSVLIISSEGCSSKPSDPLAVVVVGDIYEGGSIASRSYPNPAATTLYYSVESTNANGTIYNTAGAEIHVATVRTGDQLIFDVTGLSPGLYLLKVEEEGTVKTIRWLKR